MEISNQIQVEQQIRQLNDEWVKALVRGDGETLNRIMADDFILTYPLEGDDKADFIGGGSSDHLKKQNPHPEEKNRRVFCPTANLLAPGGATLVHHPHAIFRPRKEIMHYTPTQG